VSPILGQNTSDTKVRYNIEMNLKKYRWSKHYESAEEELVKILDAKNIKAERWTAEEYEDFPTHEHDNDTRVWCVEGSITFLIDGKEISLQTGDVLDLPAKIKHTATAGFSGCACYESKLAKL
jgi:quercetin dioxygenase-like cupin family protein